ncbi:hypothetical protein OnM2_041074 [Erysiphe neolycopersici]|uniref:Uncharacterized protein n=1 Tax=Erysiphe neolycopersici TaxID=212602 RepID=A0A420HVK1_9PEZI|nr:hypothetical protein OnM2_041074 [Erysiphe neolycopersici]
MTRKEMRSTYLAQRPVELPGPTLRKSNSVDNSHVDEETSVASQVASKVATVSPEKRWTLVGSSKGKTKKTQGSNSFPIL